MEASPDGMELHETKAEVYGTWAGTNRVFAQIISALNKAAKEGGENGDVRSIQRQDH